MDNSYDSRAKYEAAMREIKAKINSRIATRKEYDEHLRKLRVEKGKNKRKTKNKLKERKIRCTSGHGCPASANHDLGCPALS